MMVTGAVLLWLAGTCALLAFVYRKAVADAWREPVLRAPVLILESDDWGYGPVEQAPRLEEIAAVLAHHHDARGRQAVMTLGIVLAGPDTDRMHADNARTYHRVTLADPRLAAVRDAMLRGADRGVFALQLHGMEHYWPPCLMHAAKSDERVCRWLTGAAFPRTETLPSALQSRWIDTTALPSRPLPADDLIAAASEEVRSFGEIFGTPPEVVVPPTFVWTREVEWVWAGTGVRVVVTPGRRFESRDAEGRVVAGQRTYFNGEKGRWGICHVVRDCYFEPSFGHTHERTIEDLRAKTYLGRPALIEIHRMNFIDDEPVARTALDELARLLQSARAAFATLRFMSTAELAAHYRDESALVDTRVRIRVHVLLRRLACISRLRKLAWATGAVLPAWFAYVLTQPRASGHAASLV